MDSLAQGIRLVFGIGMVGAGSALVVPAGLHLVEQARNQAEQMNSGPTDMEPTLARGIPEWPAEATNVPFPGPPVSHPPRLQYVPPPSPPEPLPPQMAVLEAPSPDLAPGYRPTLQSPPPPLLDAQAAPPLAVGWTARQTESRGAVPPASNPAFEQPRIYVVRDGDDLTGIASRFYGHPSAASAILDANRGLLRDPGLLPIGAALLLPPASAVAAMTRPADHAVIEPTAHGRPSVPPGREIISRPASWLSGAGGPNAPSMPSP